MASQSSEKKINYLKTNKIKNGAFSTEGRYYIQVRASEMIWWQVLYLY